VFSNLFLEVFMALPQDPSVSTRVTPSHTSDSTTQSTKTNINKEAPVTIATHGIARGIITGKPETEGDAPISVISVEKSSLHSGKKTESSIPPSKLQKLLQIVKNIFRKTPKKVVEKEKTISDFRKSVSNSKGEEISFGSDIRAWGKNDVQFLEMEVDSYKPYYDLYKYRLDTGRSRPEDLQRTEGLIASALATLRKIDAKLGSLEEPNPSTDHIVKDLIIAKDKLQDLLLNKAGDNLETLLTNLKAEHPTIKTSNQNTLIQPLPTSKSQPATLESIVPRRFNWAEIDEMFEDALNELQQAEEYIKIEEVFDKLSSNLKKLSSRELIAPDKETGESSEILPKGIETAKIEEEKIIQIDLEIAKLSLELITLIDKKEFTTIIDKKESTVETPAESMEKAIALEQKRLELKKELNNLKSLIQEAQQMQVEKEWKEDLDRNLEEMRKDGFFNPEELVVNKLQTKLNYGSDISKELTSFIQNNSTVISENKELQSKIRALQFDAAIVLSLPRMGEAYRILEDIISFLNGKADVKPLEKIKEKISIASELIGKMVSDPTIYEGKEISLSLEEGGGYSFRAKLNPNGTYDEISLKDHVFNIKRFVSQKFYLEALPWVIKSLDNIPLDEIQKAKLKDVKKHFDERKKNEDYLRLEASDEEKLKWFEHIESFPEFLQIENLIKGVR
jgi:hypothetical protein